MKIVKEVHRKLGRFLESLQEEERTIAYNYGASIFKKTRFQSPITFIKTCLEEKLIPSGFIVIRGGHFSPQLRRRMDKASSTFSRRLMRVSLEQFSDSFDRADGTLKAAKESLEKVPDGGSFVPRLKRLVFNLNQKLFTHFSDIKRSKLQKLRPSPGSSDDDKTIVVTIPEDLELSVEEGKVLAKGLTFIPTPQFVDKTVVNDSVDNFFRRVKPHAYFNDPNQSFVDSDDDEFRKYPKKISTWTPPRVHEAIDDFMSRCRDEIDDIEIKKPKSLNISNEESAALRVLRGRDDTVIKKRIREVRLLCGGRTFISRKHIGNSVTLLIQESRWRSNCHQQWDCFSSYFRWNY